MLTPDTTQNRSSEQEHRFKKATELNIATQEGPRTRLSECVSFGLGDGWRAPRCALVLNMSVWKVNIVLLALGVTFHVYFDFVFKKS
jgi:hypothetical protein